MGQRLTDHAFISESDNLGGSDDQPFLQDIGGTNAQSDYVSMDNYDRWMAYFVLGTWNASDDLDECRVQQATDTSGTGAKDLTSDASGGNYDTDNPIDADGDFVVIEGQDENLDLSPSTPFDIVRTYCAEGGNSGTDNCCSMLVRYGYRYPKKELMAAASTGSKVYVSVDS